MGRSGHATAKNESRGSVIVEAQNDHVLEETKKRLGVGGHGDKAGMSGFDKEHVNKVIHDASKDSQYFKNEERKEEKLQEKIQALLKKDKSLTPRELAVSTASIDSLIDSWEKTRDFSRTWLHVDMDAFYAMVEERRDPSLRDKPVAVGGLVLGTSNYVARKFGVRSGMPEYIAKRLCPNLLVLPPRMDAYAEASKEVRDIFREYDPNIPEVGFSLDECHLDATDYLTKHPEHTPATLAAEVRTRVRECTKLTCSVGVAPNRILSKIVTDVNKPDGQFVLEADRESILAYAARLPVRKIFGIGKVQEKLLAGIGCLTCGDIIASRGRLALLLTPIGVRFLVQASLGLQPYDENDDPTKHHRSMSNECTFQGTNDTAFLEARVQWLARHVGSRMAKAGQKGRLVTVKMKATAYTVRQRSAQLPRYTNDGDAIAEAALRILQRELPAELRLIGVRMSEMHDEALLRMGPGQTAIESFGVEDNAQAKPTRFSYRCPVCLQRVAAATNAELNAHIDRCLRSKEEKKLSLRPVQPPGKRARFKRRAPPMAKKRKVFAVAAGAPSVIAAPRGPPEAPDDDDDIVCLGSQPP